jgi:hypothetical protein
MTMKQPTDWFVISDTHFGSTVGLMPPSYESIGGQRIQPANELQLWLWKGWETLTGMMGKDYGLILNGDLVEGNHHRTTEVVSPDPADHHDMAVQALDPLAKRAACVYVVTGTECHTGDSEHGIAKALPNTVKQTAKRPAFDHLRLKIHDFNLSATHHIGTTSRVYLESGQYSIQLGNERLEAVRMGAPVPDIIIRGHRHRGGFFSDGVSIIAVTGGWQGLTRYAHKVVPASIPMPAIIHLKFSGGELPSVGLLSWR